MSRSIRIEGGEAVIRIPIKDVHDLRCALAECPCKATKSTAGVEIRQGLVKGLARVTEGRK